jgi:hypothetical protein
MPAGGGIVTLNAALKRERNPASVKRRYFVGIASVRNPGALISPDGLFREARQR